MLTYDLTKTDGPLYKCLYECIKNDISQGKLSSGEKMPSKRTLAKNLGVSTITVENAYDQLIGEGYMFARPKRGYFIADVSDIRVIKAPVRSHESVLATCAARLYLLMPAIYHGCNITPHLVILKYSK